MTFIFKKVMVEYIVLWISIEFSCKLCSYLNYLSLIVMRTELIVTLEKPST